MLKKTIKYVDYDGEERVEDFYFNLSKAELMEMQMAVTGGFANMVRRIVSEKDIPELMKLFKDIILKSYGEKSPDGRRFIKSDELSKEFEQTEAYSQLFMSLVYNEAEASAFINGIIPSSIAEEINNLSNNESV